MQIGCFLRLGCENNSCGILLHLGPGTQRPKGAGGHSTIPMEKEQFRSRIFYFILFCFAKQNRKNIQALLGSNVWLYTGSLPSHTEEAHLLPGSGSRELLEWVGHAVNGSILTRSFLVTKCIMYPDGGFIAYFI